MATLCTLIAALRLTVRLHINKHLGLSDWLMAGGVVCLFVHVGTAKLIHPFRS